MKYFIDFEASNYWQEIISIGCVDENGRSFYSLVKPKKIDKVTKFITELTGITKEELKAAENLNEVARKFNNWIGDYKQSEFFCYGDGDLNFIKGELNRPWNQARQANKFLNGISASLTDSSLTIKKYYKLDIPIKLVLVYNHLYGDDHEQIHNALDDAMMLRYVLQHYQNDSIDPNPFPKYILPPDEKSKKVTIVDVENDTTLFFGSLTKATEWFAKRFFNASKSGVKNELKDCAQNNTLYHGYKIIIESPPEE